MIINGTAIRMIRGDTEVLTVSCEQEDGTPRPFVDGDTVYLTVSSVLKKQVTAFTEDGAAVFYLSHEETNDIPASRYKYDVQLTAKDGTVTTIIPPSDFVLEGDVTRE